MMVILEQMYFLRHRKHFSELASSPLLVEFSVKIAEKAPQMEKNKQKNTMSSSKCFSKRTVFVVHFKSTLSRFRGVIWLSQR